MAVEVKSQESPQVRSARVVGVTAGIFVVLILIAFGFEQMFPEHIGETQTVQHSFPLPGVISNERATRLALEQQQQSVLQGGDGHMSIVSAMQAIAAKGPRAFDPIGGTP